ncbi:hypothetical protein GGI04_003253 [Coemansia thaxteri]|nr:hypothetical protein GGI04_003253 [Coemansia thaxteri]
MADSGDSDPIDPAHPPAEAPAAAGSIQALKRLPPKCQACTNCRQKKIKCDGSKPTCSACLRNAAECQYVPSRRRGRPARAHREYERPYANPLPILPRQPRAPAHHHTDINPKYHPPLKQLAPTRLLPTLPHLQPATPIAPLGSILAAALFPGSPNSLSEDDAAGPLGHRSSGSESPLPSYVRPPPFLVPAGDRGGHQTMAHATPLVIPRPTQPQPQPQPHPHGSGSFPAAAYSSSSSSHAKAPAVSTAAISYVDQNIIEFFHYFNALFPIVHWPSFKEAYDDGTVPNYLILAIRALSKRYSKQPSVILSGSPNAAGQDLAAIATSLAEVATREDPNTYLIQTWIVLSMFEFGLGRIKQAADRRELAVR